MFFIALKETALFIISTSEHTLPLSSGQSMGFRLFQRLISVESRVICPFKFVNICLTLWWFCVILFVEAVEYDIGIWYEDNLCT